MRARLRSGTLLLGLLLLPSCAGPEAPSAPPVRDEAWLDATALDPELLAAVDDPADLRVLYAHGEIRGDEWHRDPARATEPLSLECPYGPAGETILERLADLRTPESVETLVEILADRRFHFDAARAVHAAHQVTRCGRLALAHLARLRENARWRRLVPELIACIEAGRLYGP